MLPGASVEFENGNIGAVAVNPDGVVGIVSSATANAPFALNQHYVVFSLKEAESLGILPSVGNYELHKTIREFYEEAGTGSELWIYGVAKTRTLDQLVTDSEQLLLTSNRRVKAVMLKYAPSVAETDTEDGLRENFPATLAAAQTLAETYTTEKIHPVVFFIEAYNFTGTAQDLIGFTETTYNRVKVMIGDTEKRTGTVPSKGAAIGIIGGRFARTQVHVNAGRVKDGALKPLEFFIVDTPANEYNVTALHDKRFVTVRTHVGKTGFFFTDDLMACTVEDDYNEGPRRRVIDKAFILANTALSNYVLDDFNLLDGGKLSAIDARTIEASIERLIAQEMSAKGELSVDVTKANDTGVKAIVDTTNNVGTTAIIKGKVSVKPKGYGRFLDFTIGYNLNS